jgi:hypothetical protein
MRRACCRGVQCGDILLFVKSSKSVPITVRSGGTLLFACRAALPCCSFGYHDLRDLKRAGIPCSWFPAHFRFVPHSPGFLFLRTLVHSSFGVYSGVVNPADFRSAFCASALFAASRSVARSARRKASAKKATHTESAPFSLIAIAGFACCVCIAPKFALKRKKADARAKAILMAFDHTSAWVVELTSLLVESSDAHHFMTVAADLLPLTGLRCFVFIKA